MKTQMIIFLVAELLAMLLLVYVLDWSEGYNQNLVTMGFVSTFIWGIYERYGKLEANKEVKSMKQNLHKYGGRD